jgi:hypothetical protein
MGAGECAGDVMRGLPPAMGIGVEPGGWGELLADWKPNRIPGLAPPTAGFPLAKVVEPLAPMLRDGLRLLSGPPFTELP